MEVIARSLTVKNSSTFFNNRFELDGIYFEEPSPQLFNFNSSLGACKQCEGYGKVLGLDEDKVIPDKNKSIYEGAVACWRRDKMGQWKNRLIEQAHHFDFPIHRSYKDLTEEQKDLLWQGNDYFDGIHSFFDDLESKSYKIQNRVMLSRYRGEKQSALVVKVLGCEKRHCILKLIIKRYQT